MKNDIDIFLSIYDKLRGESGVTKIADPPIFSMVMDYIWNGVMLTTDTNTQALVNRQIIPHEENNTRGHWPFP